MIRFSFHPLRCTILGHRVHHGFVGVLLILHDRKDYRRWLPDFLHNAKSPTKGRAL